MSSYLGPGIEVAYHNNEHLEWKQWHTLENGQPAVLYMIVHEMYLKRPMIVMGRTEVYLGNWMFV